MGGLARPPEPNLIAQTSLRSEILKSLATPYNRAHHGFAVFVACATLVLIIAGALVTSNDAGLSIPDWPTSFGSFTVPPLRGGIRFEWSHRAIAGSIVLLTVSIAMWTWLVERRRWMKWLRSEQGGCPMVSAAIEYDDRPGVIRERVIFYQTRLRKELARAIDMAVESGELSKDTDSAQLAFEIFGVELVVHHDSRLFGFDEAIERGERALERLIACYRI